MSLTPAGEYDDDQAVAVVGISAALPGSTDTDEVWETICSGDNVFAPPVTYDLAHFDSAALEGCGGIYVDRVGCFRGESLDPRIGEAVSEGTWPPDVNPSSALLRHCLLGALDGVRRHEKDRYVCVTAFSGEATSTHLDGPMTAKAYLRLLARRTANREDADWLLESARHALSGTYPRRPEDQRGALAPAYASQAISGLLPSQTPLVVVDSACASGLHALDQAIAMLRGGSYDIAVCGSAVLMDPAHIAMFCEVGALTHTPERLRIYDESSDGTLTGDGATAVVLKTLARARADGDRIHGVLLGTGLSSDGRSVSVHAPGHSGQTLAIERAWSTAGVRPGDVDWVVGHGTGTRVGDDVEITVLRDLFGERDGTCLLTSNKGTFGHTGSNAGLLSLLHVLLALRHEKIPGQPALRTPRSVEGGLGSVKIPPADTAWPARTGTVRIAGISSFGLGGSNAHAVIAGPELLHARRETQPSRTGQNGPRPSDEHVVVVAHAPLFPGRDDKAVDAWLDGSGPPPAASFGATFPLLPPTQLKIPPTVARHMDRAQLMAVEVANKVLAPLGDASKSLALTTGVVVTGAAPPRHLMDINLRLYLGQAIAAFRRLPDEDLAHEITELLTAEVMEAAPPLGPDDFAGITSSVLAGRVANYLDLRGPNVAMHAAADSSIQAIDTAMRYLEQHICDAVMVIGVQSNTLPEWSALLNTVNQSSSELAEGAAAFLLTRDGTAAEYALPRLARVERATASSRPTAAQEAEPLQSANRTYWGADGAVALLHSLSRRRPAALKPSLPGLPALLISPTEKQAEEKAADTSVDDGEAMRLELVDRPLLPGSSTLEEPTEGILVVTDDAELAAASGAAEGQVVFCPAPIGLPGAVTVTPDTMRAKFDALPFTPHRVTFLARISPDDMRDPDRIENLHDLLLTVLQACATSTPAPQGVTLLLVNAVDGRTPHPLSGLFSGTLRSAATELPETHCVSVLVGDLPAVDALRIMHDEQSASPPGGLVVHGQTRMVPGLQPARPTRTRSTNPLGPDAVVVAVGGAHGITKEILTDIAARHTPEIHILGRTTPLEDLTSVPDRRTFILQRHAEQPDLTVGQIKREHHQTLRARDTRDNLRRIGEAGTPDRVHYTTCDITDAEDLSNAMRQIIAKHGRIDLLINAATVVRPRALPEKDLTDFRKVRSIKVRGYLNLRRALSDHPPGIWCNFASLGVMFGTPGDSDYIAANEFLTWASGDGGTDAEMSIIWSPWRDVGVLNLPGMTENLTDLGWTTLIGKELGIRQFHKAISAYTDERRLIFVRDAERGMLMERQGFGCDEETLRRTAAEPRQPTPRDGLATVLRQES